MESIESAPELRIADPRVVKAEIVEYIGGVIDEAQKIALAVRDDESANLAADLGVAIKSKLIWLKEKRKAVYEPLFRAAEGVRLEYDDPIKLGTSLEKTLSAAVIKYRLDKKREEERLRLAAEAESRRIREEAARKEREAEAERLRVIREQEERERKRLADIAAEERRKKAEAVAAEQAERARIQKEQDERAKRIKEEEDARLRQAAEAQEVGMPEKVDSILDRQTPIAAIAGAPPAADRGEAERSRQEREAAEESSRRIAALEEQKLRDAEAAGVRKLQEDADKAKADAEAAEAAAASQVSVTRPDDRMRTSVLWKYQIASPEDFKKLCKAIGEGRAPVEYGGYDPEAPEKFRATQIGKDLTKLKGEFNGSVIGITTWPEESGGFKA